MQEDSCKARNKTQVSWVPCLWPIHQTMLTLSVFCIILSILTQDGWRKYFFPPQKTELSVKNSPLPPAFHSSVLKCQILWRCMGVIVEVPHASLLLYRRNFLVRLHVLWYTIVSPLGGVGVYSAS